MAVMMATFMAVMIPRAAVSADRIGEGELELLDVGFAYPGAEQPVLRNVSLIARRGETTAIIGSTGSGRHERFSMRRPVRWTPAPRFSCRRR